MDLPPVDSTRLEHLRAQDGRPRVATPTLRALLGGATAQAGREQEALRIWQSLRVRSSQGDVVASEDLATLTLFLVQMPAIERQPALSAALLESTYDAAVLSRHKQEQLGRLVRDAVSTGDRARAIHFLSWMVPDPPELDADSQFRVSAAVVATLDRDPQRVLALLGPRKDALPIVDSMDYLASAFRANAYAMQGDVAGMTQTLRELPDPRILEMVRAGYPALQLCQRSSELADAATTPRAAPPAGVGGHTTDASRPPPKALWEPSAAARATRRGGGRGVGGSLMFVGVIEVGVAVVLGTAQGPHTAALPNALVGLALLVVGVVVLVRAQK